MHREFARALSVRDLAALVNLSPSRFRALFIGADGDPPCGTFSGCGCGARACSIERTFLSVKEVMALVGYNDPSHFARDFRREHGAPPSASRRRRASSIRPIGESAHAQANRPTARRQSGRLPRLTWFEARHGDASFRCGATVMKSLALATLFFFTSCLAAPGGRLGAAAPRPLTVPVPRGSGPAPSQRHVPAPAVRHAAGPARRDRRPVGVRDTIRGRRDERAAHDHACRRRHDTTCQILHLDLGPLSLDVLGLQINLSRIILDITAQAGAGNLLGNLLCAVANLLNNPSGLARLLNSILAIL
jgi:AraC-like DNA-binding protein